MSQFKTWDTGDLAKSDAYDGSTSYTHVEGYNTGDRVNQSNLNRLNRNIYQNQVDLYRFLKDWSYNTSMEKGVVKNSLTSEFVFTGDTDVFEIIVDTGSGGDSYGYARLKPGIAINNSQIAVNVPQTHIAERQLEDIFSLEHWGVEDVSITYDFTYDKFQARIKRKNINGVVINHDFVNGGTWGTATDGYSSGLQLLEAIHGDSVFNKQFSNAVGDSLHQIILETQVVVSAGDTIWWKVNSDGNFIGDTVAGDSTELELWHFTVSADGDSTSLEVDDRTYIQWYNDFGQYMYLNVPQTWGDTGTETLAYPYGDTDVDYSHVTNQNALIAFLRKSTGDTQDNGVFGWHEDTIPDIDETRSQRFFINKDLIVLWGNSTDATGDTLGASWASIKEMSGDSWTFYGDKTFEDGSHKFLSVNTDADSFKINTAGGVDIDVDNGFTVNENSGGAFSINNSGDVTLTSASNRDVSITANGSGNIALTADGDSIDVVAATFDVDATTIGLNASGDMLLASGDSFIIDSNGGIYLIENSGGRIDIESDGAVNIDSASGQNVSLTSGGDIFLTADGDSIVFDANTLNFGVTTMGLNLTTFDLDTTGQISLVSSQAATTAIVIDASNAAGGIDIDAGTNGISMVATSGNIGINAVTAGSVTVASAGSSGNITLDSSNNLTLDAEDAVSITGGAGNSFITIAEATASTITIDANGSGADIILNSTDDLQLNSGGTADILLDAGANEVDITATLIDINGSLDVDAISANITFNTTTSGNIDLNSAGDVDIDTDAGFFVNDDSGALFTISSAGLMTATSASGQNIVLTATSGIVDVNGNELQVDASTFDVNSATQTHNGSTLTTVATGKLTLQSSQSAADAVRIYASNAAGGIDIDSDDITIDASGGHMGITTAGRVNIDANTGQLVDITSDTEVQINGGALLDLDGTNITITGDVNLDGSLDVDAISANITFNTTTSGNIDLNSAGDVDIDTDAGFFVNDDSGASFAISSAGDITGIINNGETLTFRDAGSSNSLSLNDATGIWNFGCASGFVVTAASIQLNGGVTGLTSLSTGSLSVDNLTLNSSEIDNSSGTLTLDSAGAIDLNADTGVISLKDASVTYGSLTNTSGDLIIKSGTTPALTFSGGNVTTGGTINTATISGGTLSGGTLSGGTVSGGTWNSTKSAYLNQAVLTTSTPQFLRLGIGTAAGGSEELTINGTATINNLLTMSGSNGISLSGGGDITMTTNGEILNINGISYADLSGNGDCTTYSGTGTNIGGVVATNSFAAYKVYNAVWNDYAEAFDFDVKAGKPDFGFVYKQTEKGLVKTNKRAEKGTIGVCSDSYGMLIGSADCYIWEEDEKFNKDKTKLPVALAGKVRPWVKEVIEIGDILVAGKNGFATKATLFDRVFRQDSIIGKALEISSDKEEKRIWMLVK